MATRIKSNKARCRKCGTVVESHYRHDWVSCECGAIFTDGGHDYIRRGGNPEDIEDLSTYVEDTPSDNQTQR